VEPWGVDADGGIITPHTERGVGIIERVWGLLEGVWRLLKGVWRLFQRVLG
jgi:hypothetical protein